MDIKEILAVSGMPGLYKMLANRDNGLIVCALGDTQKKFAPARKHMFTPLENITIYTEDDGIELVKVFQKMKTDASSNPVIAPNSKGPELRNYFEKIVPNHDTDRVYTSDIKKIIKWFNVLDEQGLVVLEEPKKEAKPKAAKKKATTKKKTTKKDA
ncbi:MAG: DUF5606 domain-containing protein [Chitinophagales bacterium]